MNGILLAGGTGSRLQPLTQVVNKHLLGVNGKFIIDYPIETLRRMGIQNITVILGGDHFSQVVGYLQDGSRYNLNINYVYQGVARGIAHATSLCQRFVNRNFVVILGDNVYENPIKWDLSDDKAQIVLAHHPDIKRFGVASLDPQGDYVVKIEEKPICLDTYYRNLAITGCYQFTPQYFEYFKQIQPSSRGEYEITDIIRKYHEDKKLRIVKANGLWGDVGTHESIANMNNFFYNKDRQSDVLI